MTDIAGDLMRLRAAANVEVGRRWRRRGVAIVLLVLLVLAMTAPALAHLSTLPAVAWAWSYTAYPAGEVPGDGADAEESPNGRVAVKAWTVLQTAASSHLVLRIEAATPSNPVATMSVIGRWNAQPPGIATTEVARGEYSAPGWEATAGGNVVGPAGGGSLLPALPQLCTSLATPESSNSYCVFAVSLQMGADTPLPDRILLADVATGQRVFELVLERGDYQLDICRVNGCGSLTPGV